MGILEKIATGAGKFMRRFRESAGTPLKEDIPGVAGGEIHDIDEEQFRSLSVTKRDLTEQKRERALKEAWRMYLSNPLAFRAVETTANYVVGDGMKFRARDPQVQSLLEEFWNDPVNRWDLKQFTKAMELGLYGEQFYPAAVDPQSGKVRLGYIDPLDVFEVVTDPDNVEIPRFVNLKAAQDTSNPSGSGAYVEPERRVLKIIGVDEDPGSPTAGKLKGDVFFFAINKVSNSIRGNSDLLSVIDWLDIHDEFLFSINEAGVLKTSVVFDTMVKGADEKKLQSMEKKFGRIRPGMNRFHNENVTTTAVSPNLETSELSEHARTLKNHIAAGVGLPPHWIAEAGDSNRATAAEMGVPTTKRLRSRQIFFKNMIAFMFDFVIDQAIIAKRLPADVDRGFVVIAPQIWAVESDRLATTLANASQSLVVAEDQGWITNDEAGQLWRMVADQLGIHIAALTTEPGPTELDRTYPEESIDSSYAKRIRELGGKIGVTESGSLRTEDNGSS